MFVSPLWVAISPCAVAAAARRFVCARPHVECPRRGPDSHRPTSRFRTSTASSVTLPTFPRRACRCTTSKMQPRCSKVAHHFDSVIDMIESGEMPPEKHPRPTVDEQAAFLKSVRAIFEHADTSGKPDPGIVTTAASIALSTTTRARSVAGRHCPRRGFSRRRCGMFRQHRRCAHGLADLDGALLAAAETIANRVILVDIPQPSKRYLSGGSYSQTTAQTSQGRFR